MDKREQIACLSVAQENLEAAERALRCIPSPSSHLRLLEVMVKAGIQYLDASILALNAQLEFEWKERDNARPKADAPSATSDRGGADS